MQQEEEEKQKEQIEGKNDEITTADGNKFTIGRTAGDGDCFYTLDC